VVLRTSEAERTRLGESFAALCRVYSPSLHERVCADLVEAELRELGIAFDEDGAGGALGGDCGNLLARIPGRGERWVLLCAHLDTVPANAPIEPVVREGYWENENATILGADNKATVAALLGVARHLAREPAEAGVELLFTVGEEIALAGAKEFEVGRLRSDVGYTFDAAAPVGSVIVASPTYYRLRAELRGVAAHAGIRPEDGRSAILAASRAIARMALGRVDEQSSANIGTIEGGSALNVVPDRCVVGGEARSLDAERAEAIVSEMVACLSDAANDPECECDLDVKVERLFDGYRLGGSSRELRLARAALADLGYDGAPVVSGGGADTNALRARGFAAVNLTCGMERVHEPEERIAVKALEDLLELGLALVARAAEVE
jgi:tripeptide aminopeptidase